MREKAGTDLWLRGCERMSDEKYLGDFWEHERRGEAREQPGADKPWPVCTDGAGAGQPEDIGGPGGYERLLERLDELRFDQGNGLDDFLDENDTSDGEEDDGEEWTPADRAGFDGPDDPLLRYDPDSIDRRAINLALKAEFVGKDRPMSVD